MKVFTEQGEELRVRKGRDKQGAYVAMTVDGFDGPVILTPKEAERLGNALIKAAQPKKQKDAPTEAQKEQERCERS